jgi:hypothetical protein
MNDSVPQFFTPASQGDSQAVYKKLIDNLEALQTSEIKARNRQYSVEPPSTLAIDGVPGIPFERGTPNPDLFYQGEDIVYDLLLFHNGERVAKEDYLIKASIKSSPRAYRVNWQGELNNGVYPSQQGTGYYELWIPAAATESLYAGTYYLNVMVQERVGAGKGRFDRKYVLIQTYLNIAYSNFSEHPEARAGYPGALNRSGVETVWPNTPDTIGTKPAPSDVFYLSKA